MRGNRIVRVLGVVIVLGSSVGCASGGATTDAGLNGADAGRHDATSPLRDGGRPDRDAARGDDDAGAVDVDGGADAGTATDAGRLDAGPPPDAGPPFDAGTAIQPGPGDLVIVELQGNPQGTGDDTAEYIEVLNVSGRVLDLEGVTIAHVDFPGGEPINSIGMDTIDVGVVLLPGQRALLTRSGGGYFGGATRDFVYDGFVFNNGNQNRIRLLTSGWGGEEPPMASALIDQVITPTNAFDNDLRGRALTLDPDVAPSPTAASNDAPGAFCYAAAVTALVYWGDNWGTPRQPNLCD